MSVRALPSGSQLAPVPAAAAAAAMSAPPRAPAPSSAAAEVRRVPSAAYPTIEAAVAGLPPGAGSAPAVVIRLEPHTHTGRVRLTCSVVLEGAGEGVPPTLSELGVNGVEIVGDGVLCILRRLRVRADSKGHALLVEGASPLIEDCELVGRGDLPSRGARAGLQVRGSGALPVVRGCRLSGHAGAGIAIEDSGGGLFVDNEISRCGCGFWIGDRASPILWRNTAHGNTGGGVVLRGAGAGRILGNTFVKNGIGALVESDRTQLAVLAYNKLANNQGVGLRQSPATAHSAAQAGAFVLDNAVQGNGPGPTLEPEWPQRTVHTASELLEALRNAPVNRTTFVQVVGALELTEPLVLDKPVVLSGWSQAEPRRTGAAAELRCASDMEAVVVVGAGGEAAALCRLAVRAGSIAPGRAAGAAGCVVVGRGRPTFVECDLDATPAQAASGGRFAHVLRGSGAGVAPVFVGCTLRGGRGSGVSLDQGASACLVRCQVAGNQQGGIFLGDGARAVLEECEVHGNGHFGAVVGAEATATISRTLLEKNMSGDVWLYGNENGSHSGAASTASQQAPVLLDRCRFVAHRAPALRVSSGAAAVSWQSSYTADKDSSGTSHAAAAAARVESRGQATFVRSAGEEGFSVPEVAGGGQIALLDLCGLPHWREEATSDVPNAEVRQEDTTAFEGLATPTLRKAPSPHDEAQDDEGGPQLLPIVPDEPRVATPGASGGALASFPPADPGSPTAAHSPGTPLPAVGTPSMVQATPPVTHVGSPLAAAPGPEVAAGEPSEEQLQWLAKLKDAAPGSWAQVDRSALYSLIAMLAKESRRPELLSTAGLGGPILALDKVYIRAHTGRYLSIRPSGAVVCNAPTRGNDEQFVFSTKKKQPVLLKNGQQVNVEGNDVAEHTGLLTADAANGQLSAKPGAAGDQVFQLSLHGADTAPATQGAKRLPIPSGSHVYLRALPSNRLVEVSGETVRAVGSTQGTHQRLCLEKPPAPEEVPAAAAPVELGVANKAWLLRRGVQLALVEKQHLADLLSGPKDPAQALLKAFSTLWESEWRSEAMKEAADRDRGDRSDSPQSGQSRGSTPRGARGRAENWIRSLAREARGGMGATERENGDLFVSALRSFFADTLRMSQLEANNVMRIVEAFAAALASDKVFVQAFSASMLPEAQRKQYRTPEEILFGLTYTTMMLNTDAHSSQVTQKMWDRHKFVAAGKDCGVQGALMVQIFKRITQDEL